MAAHRHADGATGGGMFPPVATGAPNPARMYDYWLGGKDNFPVDREAAEEVVRISQGRVLRGVRLNRAFLGRAVRRAARAGIRQFLDLGSGLPTRENVHEVAHAELPGSRVVYVDRDPVVHAHTTALLGGTRQVVSVRADLRHPAEILGHPQVRARIDLTEPLAVLLVSVLHFVPDEDDPWAAVAAYRDAAAPGSHLILSHLSTEPHPERMSQVERVYDKADTKLGARGRADILRFFTGFELLEPGLVGPAEWHPDTEEGSGERFAGVVGVGVKP